MDSRGNTMKKRLNVLFLGFWFLVLISSTSLSTTTTTKNVIVCNEKE